MFYSTKTKPIVSFLGVAFVERFVSGGQLLYRSVLHEATNRVRPDLNAAREIYQTRSNFIKASLNITTLGSGFLASFRESDVSDLVDRLTRMDPAQSELLGDQF